MKKMTAYMILALALLAPAHTGAQEDREAYRMAAFGNSLMGSIRFRALSEMAAEKGHPLHVESTGAAGAPMPWLWDAKPEDIQEILDKGNWDGILLQPFLRPIEDDKAGAKNFIDYAMKDSPDIKVYVYAQYINDFGLDYQDVWLQDVTQYVTTGESADHNIKGNRTKGYYEALTREIKKMYPDQKVVMVPAGHAMALLDEKIKAGLVPGVDSIYQAYADATHANNLGSYLVGMTWYACVFNESPLDLPIGGYQGDPSKPYTWVITEEQARILRETAWQAAAGHPLSGVTNVDEPVEIVTPAVAPTPVVGEPYLKRLRATFGKRPYSWEITGGALPRGLVLTHEGVVRGTPAVATDAKLTVQVTDADGETATHEYTLEPEADTAPEIAMDTTDLGTVKAGEQVKIDLKAEGGNGQLRWEFANARPGTSTMHGLRLRGTGELVGAVGMQGTHEFKLRVVDADPVDPESDKRTFTLTVEGKDEDAVMVPRVERGRIRDTWVFMRLERKGEAKMSDYVKQFTFPEHDIKKIVEGAEFNNDAAFQVVHTGSHLYAVVHVSDEQIIVNEDDPTAGDSVEIFFDIYNDREKVYNADDRHAIVTADGKSSGATGRKSQASAMRTDDGYFVFMRQPAHDMKRKLEQGAVLGFDVAVNDVDEEGGEVTRVYWHGDMRNATDTSNFGTIILE